MVIIQKLCDIKLLKIKIMKTFDTYQGVTV